MVMGEQTIEADVAVIGGGPGGYSAAFRAASLGLDTVLVSDEPRLGGVCLLRGCIPSKALLEAVHTITDAQRVGEWGIDLRLDGIDVERLHERTDDVVDRLSSGLDQIAQRRGVRIVYGRAAFEEAGVLHLTDSDEATRIRFDAAVLATGSQPVALPGVEFGGRVWESAAALRLDSVPDRLLVVGGGYVGVEMGQIYAGLGSTVSICEMEDRLLPLADPEVVSPLTDRLRQQFEHIMTSTRVEEIERSDDVLHVRLNSGDGDGDGGDGDGDGDGGDGTSEEFDAVLVAIGRTVRSEGLGLDEIGVDRREDGSVVVDESQRTSVESVYAVGDVTGGTMLAHDAFRQGDIAAEVIAGRPSRYDARAVPAVVFTDPQVAWVGMSSDDAEHRDIPHRTVTFPWRAAGRALASGRPEGITKLIVEEETDRLLGAAVVGPGAEHIVAEAGLAIEMAATMRDIGATIHTHPTISETFEEAALRALGHPRHLPS